MTVPTLQTCRNLEKFCLEQINEAMGPMSQYANMSQAVRCILADYYVEVERRKTEALRYAHGEATERRKTPRATNAEHITEVSE